MSQEGAISTQVEEAPPVNDRRGSNLSQDQLDDDEKTVLGQTSPDGKEKDDLETKKKKRRKSALLFAVVLAFFGLVAALFILFKPDLGGKARAFTDDEPLFTAAPTRSPVAILPNTESPSLPPISTESPSLPPITTPSPTFGPEEPLSLRSCEEITSDLTLQELSPGTPFKENFSTPDGKLVCADTYAGFPKSPDRNPWTPNIGEKNCELFGFQEGLEICQSVGARRCTADELQFSVGQGTGCNGDNSLLFSSTVCETDDGVSGIYTVNLEFKKQLASFFECETNVESHKTILRCCADHF